MTPVLEENWLCVAFNSGKSIGRQQHKRSCGTFSSLWSTFKSSVQYSQKLRSPQVIQFYCFRVSYAPAPYSSSSFPIEILKRTHRLFSEPVEELRKCCVPGYVCCKWGNGTAFTSGSHKGVLHEFLFKASSRHKFCMHVFDVLWYFFLCSSALFPFISIQDIPVHFATFQMCSR